MTSSTWLRAGSWLPCGALEDCRIEAGEPYLLLTIESSVKLRCRQHAGRPVPEDLDEQLAARVTPFVRPAFSSTKNLAARFDVRAAQAGKESE